MAQYNPTPINWSVLGQIGENLGTAIGPGSRMRDLRNQFSSGAFNLPNGGYDYQKMYNAIGGVEPAAAAKMMAQGQGDALGWARLGLAADVARNNANHRAKPSATDRKAFREAKADAARTESALRTLREARSLMGEKGEGIYDQYGAGLRADIGTNIPFGGSEWLAKQGVVDRDKAMRTQKYLKIMQPRAMEYLSNILKGPTSEKEMHKFMEIYADASTPNEVKAEMIDAIIKAAEEDLKVQQGIVSEDAMSAGSPASDDEWTPGEVYPTPMGNKRYLGNDEWEDE